MSKPVQLLKQQIDTLTAATAKDPPSSNKDKFIQSALTSLTTYRPYPSTFLPILEKLRFTGWADVEWTPTSWETFLTYLPNDSSSTKCITPDGIALTSIDSGEDVQISKHLPATVKSIVFGTTRLETDGTAKGMFRDCADINIRTVTNIRISYTRPVLQKVSFLFYIFLYFLIAEYGRWF